MRGVDYAQPGPFPVVPWHGGEATFFPASLHDCPEPWAVVVFAVLDGRFLLARVPRGWCTPSGHVECGESPEQAAVRETYEETGATLESVKRIGDFVIRDADGSESCAAVFLGRVASVGSLPPGSEASAVRPFGTSEIAPIYWHWDALMDAMFGYAAELAGCEEGA